MSDPRYDLDPIARPKDPTDRQRELLFAIAEHWSRKGYPPTLRELCAMLKIKSTNGVADLIKPCIRKQLLEQDPVVSRGYRPTLFGLAAMGLPADGATKLEPARLEPTLIACRFCNRKVEHVALAKSFNFAIRSYVVHWKAMAHPCNMAAILENSAQRH